MTRSTWRYIMAAPAVLILAAGLPALWGCDSDSVAPHDAMPVLTEEDSAQQAALVAVAVAEMAPQAVQFTTKTEPPYHYFFDGTDGIFGDIVLDYRLGGATGDHATYLDGTYVHIYTGFPEGLLIESPLGGKIYIIGDLMADITRGTPDTALILEGSGGELTAGAYSATFAVQDLVVSESDYPDGGPIAFDNGRHQLTLMFDGSEDVEISLDGTARWIFDLETWELTPLP